MSSIINTTQQLYVLSCIKSFNHITNTKSMISVEDIKKAQIVFDCDQHDNQYEELSKWWESLSIIKNQILSDICLFNANLLTQLEQKGYACCSDHLIDDLAWADDYNIHCIGITKELTCTGYCEHLTYSNNSSWI